MLKYSCFSFSSLPRIDYYSFLQESNGKSHFVCPDAAVSCPVAQILRGCHRRFTSRTIFRDVALAEHYNQANSLLSSIWSLISVDGTEFSEIQGQDMLKLAKSNLVHEHRTKMALRSITSLDDIQHVINLNGTAQTTVEQRSMDWFEKHGML